MSPVTVSSLLSKTLVIIPAYNEARSIRNVLEDIRRDFPLIAVAVVDDGSSDDTHRLVRESGAMLIPLPFNLGYGAALQTGYKYALEAGYDYLVQMDGDGQHSARDIAVLLDALANSDCAVVIGSRFLSDNGYRMSWPRWIAVQFFRLLIRFFTGRNITDPTSGFQALKRSVLIVYVDDAFPTDFPDADIVVYLHKLGFKFKEVPVSMKPGVQSMHHGWRVGFYMFKVLVSLFVISLEGKKPVGGGRHA